MSLLLRDGDYVADDRGRLVAVEYGEALLNEVLFRLTVRRGSFPFLPGLGSRMHQLLREKESAWESLARQYAAEALEELGNLAVTGVRVSRDGEALMIVVELWWQETQMMVTAQVGG